MRARRWVLPVLVLGVAACGGGDGGGEPDAALGTTSTTTTAAADADTTTAPDGADETTSTSTVDEGTPEGRFDVAGTELYLRCAGMSVDGQPTVVFENGAGSTAWIWDEVAEGLGPTTRACAYDRAGVGRSSPPADAGINDGEQAIADLDALLDAAGIDGPYIVVGHSLGGPLALLFAEARPDVVGVVLVDSSHPEQQAVLDEILGEQPAPSGLEPLDVEAVLGAAAEVSLGDLPLVVVTHGKAVSPPGFPAEQIAEVEAAWQQLQADLLTLSTESVQVIAEDSGHDIHRSRPDLVVAAIERILAS